MKWVGTTQDHSSELSVAAAASILEVSPATLRNWVKTGVLQGHVSSKGLFFLEDDVRLAKQKIISGEINRLRKRANKNVNESTHAHSELLKCQLTEEHLNQWMSDCQGSASEILAAIYIALLMNKGLAELNDAGAVVTSNEIEAELAEWPVDFARSEILQDVEALCSTAVDFNENLLGYAYQSLSVVGKKQKDGAYYTPQNLVHRMVSETVTAPGRFLDPCCGGGNFIAAAYDRLCSLGVKSAYKMVYGIDNDPMAVCVARATLTLKSQGRSLSRRQIVRADSLKGIPFDLEFDSICTNPPWGANFSSAEKKSLQMRYPEIRTGESFAYFILTAMAQLTPRGLLHFVLPQSFLNVKMHAELRRYLLSHYKVVSIHGVSEKFSGVFTQAVTLTVQNTKPQKEDVISLGTRKIRSAAVLASEDVSFSLWVDDESEKIFRVLESGERVFLKENAQWALGIVTGDNQKFLTDSAAAGAEPIYRGTDVFRFHLRSPETFIKYKRDQLQQVAPEQMYRHTDKLVYRFICKELVFAVDRSESLTLNSANILIPQVPGYSSTALCGVLNSRLVQYYYQKRFHSIKTLRGNLEKIPLPRLTDEQRRDLERLVKACETDSTTQSRDALDTYVLGLYGASEDVYPLILSFEISKAFDA